MAKDSTTPDTEEDATNAEADQVTELVTKLPFPNSDEFIPGLIGELDRRLLM